MILKVDNLSSGYFNKQVLNNISFELNEGDILSILGPNGCGKTTLFKTILGFLNINSGSIILNDKPIKNIKKNKLSKHIAYIPQLHQPTFSFSVFDIVLMGRTAYTPAFGIPTKKDEMIAINALEELNISHMKEELYTKLSGGERQLVLFARALCQQAKIIIMDEPTANLDFTNQTLVLKTIKSLSQKGYSIIMSTHSPDQPFNISNKILLLKKGNMIAFGETNSILTEKILSDVYDIDMDIIDVIDRNSKNMKLCLPVY